MSQVNQFKLPDVGEGLADAEIVVGVACYSAARFGPAVWGPVAGLFAVVVAAASVTLVGSAAGGAGFVVDMTIAGSLDSVPSEIAQIVYRIVQEGLTNAFKHSGSERVQVRVEITERLVVTVLDGGVSAPAADGFGIRGIRERAAAVGGTVTAGPRSDAPGWQLRATLPVRARTAVRRTVRSRRHHSRLA
jgi:signal transduction histidine kinase